MVDASARYGHPFGQPVTQAVVESLEADTLRITGDEAHHLLKSLRLKPQARFVATDGAGTVARLELTASDRRGLEARVLERASVPRPALRFWLVGDAEGTRGDWLVEKATELGAWAFVPLEDPGPGRRARWGRVSRAALKQSLGAWALALPDPGVLDADTAGTASTGPRFDGLWLADPEGAPLLAQELPSQGDWLLVSGPPGGFAAAEREAWLGRPGSAAVGLGPLRLRAESAALALLVGARLRSSTGQETA
ncbi:MAG: RsmE family RNA methyltransferase [Candidatus Eiseniibacteriota bacterium]